MAIVRIIGVGDDGAESLGNSAKAQISAADLLIGAPRLLRFFPNIGNERLSLGADLAEVVKTVENALNLDRTVVVLASGDPNFFGIARRFVAALGKDRVEIVPNVSSVQLAFARIKESWDDATFFSVHGRGTDDLVEVVQSNPKIAILTDNLNSPSVIAERLKAAELCAIRAFVCENLGSSSERITEAGLDELIGKEFSPLNVLVLMQSDRGVPSASRTWATGIPDDEFHQRKPLRGLITKAEVRVVSLSKLEIREDSVVWDVGAGSGSVSIEAAMLAKRGRVFAVERNAEDASIIRRNVGKFGVRNVGLVIGNAPEALSQLPDPDAVFVGGSGGRLREIVAASVGRLRKNGRIVVNVTTVENLGAGIAALRETGVTCYITQVAVSRGKAVGDLTRLEALDPVFIVSGKKSVE